MADTEMVKHDSQNNGIDPFERRSVQIAESLPPCAENPTVLYAPDGHSHPGDPLPSRPARAAANNRQYGDTSQSVTPKGQINGPDSVRPGAGGGKSETQNPIIEPPCG